MTSIMSVPFFAGRYPIRATISSMNALNSSHNEISDILELLSCATCTTDLQQPGPMVYTASRRKSTMTADERNQTARASVARLLSLRT